MDKDLQSLSSSEKIGLLIGTVGGLKTGIEGLSKRFEEHLKEHRQGWYWIFPTVISLATFIVMALHFFGT